MWMLSALVVAVSGGCSSLPLTRAEAAGELAAGYGSLHQLLTDESSVDKLLLVKSVGSETEEAIEGIAEASSRAAEKLEALSRQSPSVRLDAPSGLPLIEQATRDSIASKTAMDLLFSDETFEVRLLMSQGQALRYGRFLAEQLRELETNEARREWLDDLARRFEEDYKRVVDLLEVGPS
jgi:hypothetical protein